MDGQSKLCSKIVFQSHKLKAQFGNVGIVVDSSF